MELTIEILMLGILSVARAMAEGQEQKFGDAPAKNNPRDLALLDILFELAPAKKTFNQNLARHQAVSTWQCRMTVHVNRRPRPRPPHACCDRVAAGSDPGG